MSSPPKRKRRSKSADEAHSERTGYVKTWDELAAALGITRRGLILVRTRHAKSPDLPRQKSDGRHLIDEWKAFFATHGIQGRQMDDEATAHGDTSPAVWKARMTEQQVIKLKLANELTRRQQIALEEVQTKLPPFLMAIRTGLDQMVPDLATSLEGIIDYYEIEEIIQERHNKFLLTLTSCPWLDEAPIVSEDTK